VTTVSPVRSSRKLTLRPAHSVLQQRFLPKRKKSLCGPRKSVWNGQRSFRDRGEPTPYPRGDRDGPNNNRTTATSVCTVLGHRFFPLCAFFASLDRLLFSRPKGRWREESSSGWRRGGGGRDNAVVYRAGNSAGEGASFARLLARGVSLLWCLLLRSSSGV
jgi:hypothetical protein